MEDVIKAVEKADDELLDRLIPAIIRRKNQLYPLEELVVLSLPRYDANERKRILLQIMEYLE